MIIISPSGSGTRTEPSDLHEVMWNRELVADVMRIAGLAEQADAFLLVDEEEISRAIANMPPHLYVYAQRAFDDMLIWIGSDAIVPQDDPEREREVYEAYNRALPRDRDLPDEDDAARNVVNEDGFWEAAHVRPIADIYPNDDGVAGIVYDANRNGEVYLDGEAFLRGLLRGPIEMAEEMPREPSPEEREASARALRELAGRQEMQRGYYEEFRRANENENDF